MRRLNNMAFVSWAPALALTLLPGSTGCTLNELLNQTASLGGDTAGDRGSIRIAFVNHTPFRAIFTYGSYSPDDLASTTFPPEFQQFSVDPDSTKRLEGNSESLSNDVTCARVVSIGGADFIQAVKDNAANAADVANASEEAFTPGISFSDKALDDPEAGQPTAGSAPAVEKLIGADFQCGTLLVFTFEVDDAQPSGFRVDYQVILP